MSELLPSLMTTGSVAALHRLAGAPVKGLRLQRGGPNKGHLTIARRGIFVLTFVFMAQPAAAQSVLFEGARVIIGDGSPAIEDGAFLVVGDVITRIGRRGNFAVPQAATRIDLGGKTVMPAIVSTHVHPGFQRRLTYSVNNFTRETIMDDLNRELYFGISTVMSLGIEKGDVMFQIRADQAAGLLGGARLLLAGRGIGAPNAGPGAPAYSGIAYEITTEDQARSAVQELAAKKVDTIKIWVDDRGGRAPSLPITLSSLIIDEGHRVGLKVTAHIFYHKDAVELAAAGINAFAHLVRDTEMSDALITTMIAKGIYVMPNIGTPELGTHASTPGWFEEPYLAGLLRDTEPPEVIARVRDSFARRDAATVERNRRNYTILQNSVAKLSTAGARIILGSDTGLEDNFFGYAEQKELELMVEAGMTPGDVIIAATSRSAEFLGTTDRGSLVPGKRADFLVLDANPLDDIRNTRRIAKMYLAGAEVDRSAIRASLPKSTGN
jgi:imidazolonepropionase-like amidohydrolase